MIALKFGRGVGALKRLNVLKLETWKGEGGIKSYIGTSIQQIRNRVQVSFVSEFEHSQSHFHQYTLFFYKNISRLKFPKKIFLNILIINPRLGFCS